jgi:DnaJ-class molecular chaperone
MTHHETLGVALTATPEEIKAAYRRLARLHHPDAGGDQQRFKQSSDAYEVLNDPQLRQAYEENLRRRPVEIITHEAQAVVDAYFDQC